MKPKKQSLLRQNTFDGDFESDPRTPRERMIYPYTVEALGEDQWGIHKDGIFVGPIADGYEAKDEKLIPLLDCLNREHAKAFQ